MTRVPAPTPIALDGQDRARRTAPVGPLVVATGECQAPFSEVGYDDQTGEDTEFVIMLGRAFLGQVLTDAACYRQERAEGYCLDCACMGRPGLRCAVHAAELGQASAYRVLAARIGVRR
jgi:hypothetical protein